MCENCGCSITGSVEIRTEQGHTHTHSHGHHHHHHGPETARTVEINEKILSKNDRFAEQNRGYFFAKKLLVINVLSSPGAGKTTLLQKTMVQLGDRLPGGIIVGDLETDNDAQRLRASGAPAVQIVTGTLCHLEADMVAQAAQNLPLDRLRLLVIENVGNLVCPAAYDLGENLRVVLFSVTEGEDKPLKYPTMFKSADVVIISKIDVATVLDFDRDQAIANLKKVAPGATILELSAKTGVGLAPWEDLLIHHWQQRHAPQNPQTQQLSPPTSRLSSGMG